MKKIFCILLAVLFSLFSSISFASATTFHVENAGLSITIPDNMYVFDRNTSPDDGRIPSLGLTYEGLMASFTAQDIYLDALDIDNLNEIVVICEPSDDKDFALLSPDELYNAVLSEENAITQSGRTIEDADIFEHGNFDFVKTISKANDTHMQYTTVHNGVKLKIRLIDFDGNLTKKESENFEEIVESIAFDAPLKAEENKETEEPLKTETMPDGNIPTADAPKKDMPYGNLSKLAFIILAAIAVCTIPALVFRFVFAGGGIKKAGAKVFTFIYTLAMTFLFYYIVTKHQDLNLSLLICLVPILWSFVVYKIVKR